MMVGFAVPASAHGLCGVAQEVQKHLFNLGGDAGNGGEGV
jgi:hypothetical protein